MAKQEKTFKVICAHCKKPFHVRFPLARAEEDDQGQGEVVVNCQYCGKNVRITLPRKYIQEDHLLRGIESTTVES